MNKYQEALNTLSDTLTYYMVRKDLALLPSDNEIYDAMATLRKFVDKAESFEWIPFEMEDGFLYCQIPDDGEDILVTDGKVVWHDTWIECDEGYVLDSGYELYKCLAWMPLPKPYKEKEND